MNQFKSTIEEYFSYYLNELKDNGFIEWWKYESNTYNLSDSISSIYLQYDKKGNIKEKSESLMREASITSDFTIKWLEKAKNVFYLDRTEPIHYMSRIKQIPFRVDNIIDKISQVEIKGSSEASTSSSVSFPYKQKWCYQMYNIYIQKIKPFHPTKGLLFEETFTPLKVMEYEIYKRDCKWGKAGTSKIKYKNITIEQFLQNIN